MLNDGERWRVEHGDLLELLPRLPADSADLVFGSPPYEAQRTYGIGFNLRGQAWVDWMVNVYRESQRVCRGLVAFVVEGFTKDYRYSATPALLMADLHRAGFDLRKPPAYCRVGIPGSGGKDWLRNDYEFVVCTTRPGRLPWADAVACGNKPVYAPGGAMCYRQKDGNRVKRNGFGISDTTTRRRTGSGKRETQNPNGRKVMTREREGTHSQESTVYKPPEKANPGNLVKCNVGGNHLGSPLAHENEAPYPEKLAEFFVLSFCPPGGLCIDPFSGSGTTGAVCLRHGRRFWGCDVRESQVDLSRKRIANETPCLL